MNIDDCLTLFEQYKEIKEIADLIDEIKKLRLYYSTQQYDAMQQHIRSLAAKYPVETLAWNTSHQIMPTTAQQSYISAATFLRLKGNSILIQKSIKTQEQFTVGEAAFIDTQ